MQLPQVLKSRRREPTAQHPTTRDHSHIKEPTVTSKSPSNDEGRSPASAPAASDTDYKIGPGHPPKEYQFKPGQSGNPKGAKRKPPSIALDLKTALERALNKTVKLRQGDKERTVSMATAGIEQLVAQYAKGDRHARRDLIALADKLCIDLIAGQHQEIQQALAANHETILRTYVERQYDKVFTPARVFAPPELLDDDPQDKNQE
jgi:uncharacterized protein DUF5681